METIEYRTVDKSKWGAGPWQDEPDKMQWQDEATGLPCLIVRAPWTGALCGYVGVPQGHPAYGQDYYSLNVDVHGGLTFADKCQTSQDEAHGVCHVPATGEPDNVWWLGFDCNHCGDFAPVLDAMRATSNLQFSDETYRDIEYVKNEVEQLALQLSNFNVLKQTP